MIRKLPAAVLGLFSNLAKPHSFEAGQVWHYKTRPGEDDSRLHIVKVESWPTGERIFHVHADRLRVVNPMLTGGWQTELSHAPVSERTLELSVTRLQDEQGAPVDIAEGYDAWKEQFDQGAAGVFTVSISEIIDLIEGVVVAREEPGL